VLVVDDDFMVARVHRKFVERVPGFEVVAEAHTAADALAAATEHRPDLVLLDIYLPDANGLGLLEALSDLDPPVDVLVVSAADDAETVQRAFRGGVQHYLIKPFTADTMAARLEEYRRRRESMGRLGADEGTVAQHEVDALFGRSPQAAPEVALPKGFAEPTLRLVGAALREAAAQGGTLSASECADRVGLARVSARRYLELLVAQGLATVAHRYGGTGRPERRYEWRGR
jgi:response regulator of citrate/malate metabolism